MSLEKGVAVTGTIGPSLCRCVGASRRCVGASRRVASRRCVGASHRVAAWARRIASLRGRVALRRCVGASRHVAVWARRLASLRGCVASLHGRVVAWARRCLPVSPAVGCSALLLLDYSIANSALLCTLVHQIVPCRFFRLLLCRGVPGFVQRPPLVQPKRALFWLAVWHFQEEHKQ